MRRYRLPDMAGQSPPHTPLMVANPVPVAETVQHDDIRPYVVEVWAKTRPDVQLALIGVIGIVAVIAAWRSGVWVPAVVQAFRKVPAEPATPPPANDTGSCAGHCPIEAHRDLTEIRDVLAKLLHRAERTDQRVYDLTASVAAQEGRIERRIDRLEEALADRPSRDEWRVVAEMLTKLKS